MLHIKNNVKNISTERIIKQLYTSQNTRYMLYKELLRREQYLNR